MVDTLRLPEGTRIRLQGLWKEAQQANLVIERYQHSMTTVIEMIGLDPSLNHSVNWETGVITPAEPPTKPELVKEEEAAS